ncbi:hypothetical protein L210DRAFT_3534648 [Boletus edulis BED1]|uniref:Uncharacterized protein n=1 Tax=Boletus edulis BED1 TaxID=1328754 RepID=A0AAD4GHM7_BOLED|nr:hypothetical protein L210DRAFT_3534648 [Boletus edulis BED1]
MPRTGTTKRYPGLSKTILSHTCRGRTRVTTRLTAGKQAERMQKVVEKRSAEISGPRY